MRCMILFLTASGLALSLPSLAEEANDVLREQHDAEIRDVLRSQPNEIGLRAWIDGESASEHSVGEEISFRVRADANRHLTVLSIDSHGVGSFLVPSGLVDDARMRVGEVKSIPEDRFYLEAAPPLGMHRVYFIATEQPVDPALFAPYVAAGQLVPIDPARLVDVTEDLRSALDELGSERVAVTELEHRIVGRSEEGEYSKRDVLAFFTERKRFIRRPRLDVHVRFAFDSATLVESEASRLAPIAEAMKDPQLKGQRFIVGGHTDSTGPDEYNVELSRRRAEAVRQHLSGTLGIQKQRLGLKAHGPSKALETNETSEGRRENRRVDFALIQEVQQP